MSANLKIQIENLITLPTLLIDVVGCAKMTTMFHLTSAQPKRDDRIEFTVIGSDTVCDWEWPAK